MKTVKFNRLVMVPKIGTFNKGDSHPFEDKYAKHLVENMKCGAYVRSGSVTNQSKKNKLVKK